MNYLEIQGLFKDFYHSSRTVQDKQSRAFQYCRNPAYKAFHFFPYFSITQSFVFTDVATYVSQFLLPFLFFKGVRFGFLLNILLLRSLHRPDTGQIIQRFDNPTLKLK